MASLVAVGVTVALSSPKERENEMREREREKRMRGKRKFYLFVFSFLLGKTFIIILFYLCRFLGKFQKPTPRFEEIPTRSMRFQN